MSQRERPDLAKLARIMEETIAQEPQGSERIQSYLKECQQFGIDILPLHINKSCWSCGIEDEQNIRMGFSLLAPCAADSLEEILLERQAHGDFRSFQDFCTRIDCDNLPEDFLSRAIQAGTFDAIEPSRARLFAGKEKILQMVRQAKEEQNSGQFSLFAARPPSSKNQDLSTILPDVEEWTEEEMIGREKDAIGFSFTEYLLDTDEDQPFSESLEITLVSEEEPGQTEASLTETDAIKSSRQEVIIQLPLATTTESLLLYLREILRQYVGNSRVTLEFIDNQGQKTSIVTHEEYAVDVSEMFINELEILLGERPILDPLME